MRRTFLENPDYWENSPYPSEVERYFKSWFAKPIKNKDETDSVDDTLVNDLVGENKWDALYKEVVSLYADLKNAKPPLGDSSESMAYFRTATGLMDKLVGHQERCLGIKQLNQFHSVVIDIMENVLNDQQRAEAMERLENSIQSS